MKNHKFLFLFLLATTAFLSIESANQTDTVFTPLSEDLLPYTIRIEQDTLEFPNVVNPTTSVISAGLNGFVLANYNDKWLLLTGRTTGQHQFGPTDNNFPANRQNQAVYVIDIINQTISYRFLTDPSAGLTTKEIECLSAQVPEVMQLDDILLIMGGYGVDTENSTFNTKPILTKLNIPGVIDWVETGNGSFKSNMTQIENPFFAVTGGVHHFTQMHRPMLLTLGQNFTGAYNPTTSNGIYTKQIQPFYFGSFPEQLVLLRGTNPPKQDAYRRRDLNSFAVIEKKENTYAAAYMVLAGVFTLTTGAWTVPIFIDQDGSSFMPDPDDPNTFKQGMNAYNSAHIGLFSKESNDMFVLLFGGISFLYYDGATFVEDSELAYDGSVSTIKIDENKNVTQYLMNNQFPSIVFPGQVTNSFFGAESKFISTYDRLFPNGVVSLDSLEQNKETLIGYIVSGIQSRFRNNNGGGSIGNSFSSPYIFKVYVTRK